MWIMSSAQAWADVKGHAKAAQPRAQWPVRGVAKETMATAIKHFKRVLPLRSLYTCESSAYRSALLYQCTLQISASLEMNFSWEGKTKILTDAIFCWRFLVILGRNSKCFFQLFKSNLRFSVTGRARLLPSRKRSAARQEPRPPEARSQRK